MNKYILAAISLSSAFAQTNLDFDAGETGWNAVRNWTVAEVRREGCRNRACLTFTRPAEPPPDSFGNVMQSIDAAPHAGKRVVYRAAVRVEGAGAEDSAMLWLRVDRPDRRKGFFDNMHDRPIRAGEWAVYEIAGDIDADAVKIHFGIMAHGKARVWIDDASLEFAASQTSGPAAEAARAAIQKQYDRLDAANNAGRWDETLEMALPEARVGTAAMKVPIGQL